MKTFLTQGNFLVAEEVSGPVTTIWLLYSPPGSDDPQRLRYLQTDSLSPKERKPKILEQFSKAAGELAFLESKNPEVVQRYLKKQAEEDPSEPSFSQYESHGRLLIANHMPDPSTDQIGVYYDQHGVYKRIWAGDVMNRYESDFDVNEVLAGNAESPMDQQVAKARAFIEALEEQARTDKRSAVKRLHTLVQNADESISKLDIEPLLDGLGHHPNRLNPEDPTTQVINQARRSELH